MKIGYYLAQFFELVVTLISLPLMTFNFAGGFVAGVWLLFLGQWSIFAWGLFFSISSTFFLSFCFIPAAFVSAAALEFGKKNRFFLYFFGFLSLLWGIGVVTIWSILIMEFFAKKAFSYAMVPTLIWAYGSAVGPFSYMASKGADDNAAFTTLFVSLGVIAGMVSVLGLDMPIETIRFSIIVFMAICLLLESIIAYEKLKIYNQ